MTQEELDRFLATVHSVDLVGYLAPKGEESALTALDRRLRWAARARNQTENAEEAAFLLRNQDALRQQVESIPDDFEEEWVEFADAGKEAPGPSLWVSSDESSRTESLDMDAPIDVAPVIPQRTTTPPPAPSQPVQRASTPAPTVRATVETAADSAAAPVESPVSTRRAPSGPPPRPAAIQRPPSFTPPAPDGTPAFTEPRVTPDLAGELGRTGGTPVPSGTPPTQRPATPPPSISRLSGRHRSPQSTPPSGGRSPRITRSLSPSPARGRGGLSTPRPLPSRWSSATPPPGRSGSVVPGRGPSPAVRAHAEPVSGRPSYGAPDSAQPRVPSPTPVAGFPAATPRGSSYADVHIRGDARFMRSNDQYGTAEVVYESEFDHKHLGVPTPVSRTPSGTNPRVGEADILGSLRSSARKGTPAPTVLQRAGRKKGINPAVVIAFLMGTVVLIALLLLVGINLGLVDIAGLIAADTPEIQEQPASFDDVPKTPIPVDTPADGATDVATDGAATDVAPEDGTATDAALVAPIDAIVAPKPAAPKPAATTPKPKPAAATPKPKPKPAATTPKPAEGTAAAGTTTTKPETTAGTSTDGTTEPVVETPVDKPVEAPPPEPADPFDGDFRGSVGSTACLADLTQKGETVSGTITVAGLPYRVAGRYNEAKRTLYLRGVTDENIVFRGDVDGTTVKGTARLGAGQIPQAFQLVR